MRHDGPPNRPDIQHRDRPDRAHSPQDQSIRTGRRGRPDLYDVDYRFGYAAVITLSGAVIGLWLNATRAIVDFDISSNLAVIMAFIVDAVAIEQSVNELRELVSADAMTGATDYLTAAVHGKYRVCIHLCNFVL